MAALAWNDSTIDAVVCGDDVKDGRPPVSDTVLDFRAGHHAGVRWNVGVLSGAHDRQALESAPHTHLLRSVADLMGIWGETRAGGQARRLPPRGIETNQTTGA